METERHALTNKGRRLCYAVFKYRYDSTKAAKPWWTKRESEVTCPMCLGAIDWCDRRGVKTKRGGNGRFMGQSIAMILKMEGWRACAEATP